MKISDNDWRVVEKRLESMSEDFCMCTSCKRYTKKDLINEIKNRTEFGEHYVKMQIKFIEWLLSQLKQDMNRGKK